MEEIGSCAPLMLHLRAGCTAPPPTPVRKAEPGDAIASHHHTDDPSLWSSGPNPTLPFVDELNGSGDGEPNGTTSRIRHQSSTPPSRAELDELASFLMQQSLMSTPTLLSPPSMRRKVKISSCSDAIAMDQHGCGKQKTKSLIADNDGLSVHVFCTEGISEDSKADIQSACEEKGAFYVRSTDFGHASFIQLDQIFSQCPRTDGIFFTGSYPLLPLSQLMTCDQNRACLLRQEDDIFDFELDLSSLIQDTPSSEAAINFRNTLRMLANSLLKISKELLKVLLEVCCEEWSNLQDHHIKPVLYLYKLGNNEPGMLKKDVILSIRSPGDFKHQGRDERDLLLVVLGNHIQSWSNGKFKIPSLVSSCGFVDEKMCFQLDLVYHP